MIISMLLLLALSTQVDIEDLEASSTEKSEKEDPVSLETLSPELQKELESSPYSTTKSPKGKNSANNELIRKLEIPFHIIYILIGFPL